MMSPPQDTPAPPAGPVRITRTGPDVLGTLRTGTPCIMGILNVTPDSFSDGGTLPSVAAAVSRAHTHVTHGAHLIDIGGESTRPGAQSVDAKEQMRRVLPVIDAIDKENWGVPLSIDTCDPDVARAALEHGVRLVNDVTGLRSDALLDVVAQTGAHVIVMHMRGTPQSMQDPVHLRYDALVPDVVRELRIALQRAHAGGIAPDKLWVDPGLGFAKTSEHNWQLLRHLGALCTLDCPLVIGASRKGFLKDITPNPPQGRDAATAAVCCAAVVQGAQMLRVHHVAAVKDAVATGYKLRSMS